MSEEWPKVRSRQTITVSPRVNILARHLGALLLAELRSFVTPR
jgi:hypothetical protein